MPASQYLILLLSVSATALLYSSCFYRGLLRKAGARRKARRFENGNGDQLILGGNDSALSGQPCRPVPESVASVKEVQVGASSPCHVVPSQPVDDVADDYAQAARAQEGSVDDELNRTYVSPSSLMQAMGQWRNGTDSGGEPWFGWKELPLEYYEPGVEIHQGLVNAVCRLLQGKRWHRWTQDDTEPVNLRVNRPSVYELYDREIYKHYGYHDGLDETKRRLGMYKFTAEGDCITIPVQNPWCAVAYELEQMLALEAVPGEPADHP